MSADDAVHRIAESVAIYRRCERQPGRRQWFACRASGRRRGWCDTDECDTTPIELTEFGQISDQGARGDVANTGTDVSRLSAAR